MAEFLNVLGSGMETPLPYGWFHICALALVAAAAFLLARFGRDSGDRAFRLVCFGFWAVLFLFESYKQIIFSFNYNGGDPYWDYQWYAFPFQLCSAQLYVLPFVFLSREGGAVRTASTAFLATYSLFAGIAVMLYPVSVFIGTIGINIQTMVWHGSQVILGVFFLARYRGKLDRRFFVSGAAVFLILVSIALVLDAVVPRFTDETFNMFFISPFFPSTLPVLEKIYPLVPWPVFLAIYLVGYTAAALIVFFAAKGLVMIPARKKAASA